MSDEMTICPCCGQEVDVVDSTEFDQEEYDKAIKRAVKNTRIRDLWRKVTHQAWKKAMLKKSKGIG